MKAVEYAEKYSILADVTITDETYMTNLKNLANEMRDEMIHMMEIRHIKTVAGFESLKKEFNIKGNKIRKLLNNTIRENWYDIIITDIMAAAKASAKKGS